MRDNWQDIVNKLRERHTLQYIGDHAGLKKNSVHDLSTGKTRQPLYGAGVELLKLHKRVSGGKK